MSGLLREAPGSSVPADARALQKQLDNDPILGTDAPEGKTVATIKVELLLRGFSVHDTVTGGWFVARWNLSHYRPRLIDLEAFLRRIGGAA